MNNDVNFKLKLFLIEVKNFMSIQTNGTEIA